MRVPIPPVSRVDDLCLHELTEVERRKIITISEFKDEEKSSIFDALDVFVLPSVGESRSVSRALRHGCVGSPVIGADIGPTRDVIHDDVSGVLVKPNDPTALVEHIIALLSDPFRREQMGQIGRKTTLAHFTWDRIIDKMEHIYHEVAGETPKP